MAGNRLWLVCNLCGRTIIHVRIYRDGTPRSKAIGCSDSRCGGQMEYVNPEKEEEK